MGMCSACALMIRASAQNADLSDVLMDRAVLNDSNLTNANLSRAILTRQVRLPCCSQSFCERISQHILPAAVMPSHVNLVPQCPRSAVVCQRSDAWHALQE